MPTSPASQSAVAARTDLVGALTHAVRGDVDSSARRRGEYSTDASNYRVVPDVVVIPRDVDDLLAALDAARSAGAPITLRGGGTSVAGNAVGPGIVVDLSRHLNRILEIDPAARTARVEPGVVMADLQRAALPHGLRFGPDPSTQARATFGGMIGNNACGPHAVAFGKTSDNVVELDVIDGLGRRFTAGKGLDVVPGLDALVGANLETIRTELGRFGRQVSGYSLEHLLPENEANLARALVGTEGTVAAVLGATITLVDIPSSPVLVVLGYPDMATAGDAVPAILAHGPLAVEGLDARLVDVVRRHKGAARVPELPAGAGWLLVEVGGANDAEALDRARRLAADAGTTATRVIPAGAEATAMWRIREDGAGLAGRTASGKQAWPGWEDAAVPPDHLGRYLREFDALMASHGVDGLQYGHFGDGCVHVRIDLPLEKDGSRLRAFMLDAAHLVASHGGSLSGEHGDGRARSELLPIMYSEQAIGLFAAFKDLLDPNDVLNPGVVVRPAPIDADLRRPQAAPRPHTTGFAFRHDDGDFTKAVHRCVGVGRCRADTGAAGDFMCPSYLATKDEKDVTRGRARTLQEMANGRLITGGWTSPEVRESLDLCLSCKACSSECPAGVDMAMYRSEVLFRTYRRRLRPIRHYALGWLPRWGRLAGIAPRLLSLVLGYRPIGKIALSLMGMDSRRTIPPFAAVPFRRWAARNGLKRSTAEVVAAVQNETASEPFEPGTSTPILGDGIAPPRPRVVLWTDSFSDAFAPGVPQAALTVLRDAGYDVIVPDQEACCGLTWVSTGQLDGARKRLKKLLGILGPFAVNGIPIVGTEPSCTALLRSDLLDLVPDDPRAVAVSQAVSTVAELLTAPSPLGPGDRWSPPRLDDVTAVVQPHCHHHSVMGFDADQALLEGAGATLDILAGCCGLAGNFGMEKGHYEVSVAVAENALLPALREAGPGTILLADGFSCRTQADQLAHVRGVHLVELLAERIAARAG